MGRARIILSIGFLLLAGGCASYEVHAVVGTEREPFTGVATSNMSSGGHIDISNGKGTSCFGDFVYTGMASGHGLLACNDGQRAVIQFRSLGLTSGYGYGSSNTGRPIRFYVGLSSDEGAKYIGDAVAGTASAPNGPAKTKNTGSGFFITRQGHLITNAHVVDGCTEVTVTRIGSGTSPATIVARDKQNDLALLQAATPAPTFAVLRGGRQIRQGETAVAYGFPLNWLMSSGGTLTTGTVSALTGTRDDTRYLQVSTQLQPGNSGGPLMDATGAVVGVTTSSLDDAKLVRTTGAVPQNVNFALKADVVKTFLDSTGIAAETSTSAREISLPDIGEKARVFTALIECKR